MTVSLGPSLEIQGVYVAIISANADLKTLIGNTARINPPQSTTWPGSYITIGEGQEVPDLAECIDGSEVYTDIHVWSQKDSSFADVKKIMATIWKSISSATITLSENRFLLLDRDGQQYLRDPDGITLHGVLTIRALTEPAA